VEGLACELSFTELGSFDGAGFFTGGAAIVGDILYKGDSTLEILNIEDPSRMTRVSTTEVCSLTRGAAFLDDYAYIACGWTGDPDGIQVWSIADPSAPSFVRTVDPSVKIWELSIAGEVMVARETNGLRIYDLTSPGEPAMRGTAELTDCGGSDAPFVHGTTSYSVCPRGLLPVDISDPGSPVVAANYPWPNRLSPLFSLGGLLLAGYQDQILALDVSTPTEPRPLGQTVVEDAVDRSDSVRAWQAVPWGGFAVMATHGLSAADLRAPARPTMVSAYAPAAGIRTVSVLLQDDVAFALDQQGQVTSYRLSCE